MLFLCNEFHFGWIDIDCFVFEENILKELSDIDEKTAINAIWSYDDTNSGLTLSNTFIVFVNIDIIKKIMQKGINISPYPSKSMLPHKHETITLENMKPEVIDIVKTVCKLDDDGYPLMIKIEKNGKTFRKTFYDTLIAYQYIAYANGYRINKIRDLNYEAADSEVSPDRISKEIAHIGGVSYYKKFFANSNQFDGPFVGLLFIDYLILKDQINILPRKYYLLYKQAENIIATMNYNYESVCQFLDSRCIYDNRDQINKIARLK
jgi:hypothetical protein